jgi:hypothetical protein
MRHPKTELSKGGDNVLLRAQQSIEAAVEATATLHCDSNRKTIEAVISSQNANLKRALRHMETSDEYHPLVGPYKRVAVIMLNVLSFLLLVECEQPIYRADSFFAPFHLDGMVCLDLEQEQKTAVGAALMQMKNNLNVAWKGIKDNGLENKQGPLYTEIDSMVLLFQEKWRQHVEPTAVDNEETIGSDGSDGSGLDAANTVTGSSGSNGSRGSRRSSTNGGTASIVPSTASPTAGSVPSAA